MDPLRFAALKDRLDSAPDTPVTRAFSRPPPQTRIIKAAEHLFSRHGVRSVTLEEIAEQADTSTDYVRECFGSLEDVVSNFLKPRLDVATRAYADYWTSLEQKHGRAAEEQLRDWIRKLAPSTAGPTRPLPFSSEAMELADQPNHKGLALIKQWKDALRIKIAMLCCDAFYRDPQILADKLLMLVEGARVQAATFGGEESGKRLIEAAEDLFKRHWQPQ